LTDIRIVIGGPHHSGKSTFTIYLEDALDDIGINVYHHDYDPFSPTKEYARGKISKNEREKLKKSVTPDYAKREAKIFRDLSDQHAVILGDLPGKISGVTHNLCSTATHAIILCAENQLKNLKEWEDFFNEKNIPIIAILKSNLDGKNSTSFKNKIISGEISNMIIDDMDSVPPEVIRAIAEELKKILNL